MRIVIIRHGKVNYCWSNYCTSKEFDNECSEYDIASIKDENIKIPNINYQKIYISELSRSRDTAKKIFAGSRFKKTRLINEVPLRSGFDTRMRMPLWFWNTIGRIQWFLGISRQKEGYLNTRKRAGKFVKYLLKENEDCLVVTHGFYMHSLMLEMRKAGFRMSKFKIRYKNGEYVLAER